MQPKSGGYKIPHGVRVVVLFALAGVLLGFVASSMMPYGWLITYPLTGLYLGSLLACWILWPWEAPHDWRSHLWDGMPESTRRRIAELDAFRAFAVTMVCGCHLWPNSRIFECGWSGVDLFLVLSGYLITDIVLRNGRKPGFLRAFYARRTLRIWPIYYLNLIAIIAFAPLIARSQGLINRGAGFYLTYTQNVFASRISGDSVYLKWYGPTWTLALEEQFYLLWPALILILPRRVLPAVATVWVLVACGTRGRGPELMTLHGRGDGLALGGLLAWLLLDRQTMRVALGKYRVGFGLVMLAALGLLTMLVLSRGRHVLAYPPEPSSATLLFLDLLFFGLIGLGVCSAGHPALALLRDKRIVGLGVISYGVYVYHLPVFRGVEELAQHFGMRDRLELDLLKLALTVLVAALSWRFIEQPILSLKDRFAYNSPVALPRDDAPAA
jgi:peptidoglycan/LPS O-acetylase OafA/YrhL